MKGLMILFLVIGLCSWAPLSCSEEPAKPPAAPPPEGGVAPPVSPGGLPPMAKVVDWQELQRFIPKPPKGWKAGKPVGKVQRMGPLAISSVARALTKGSQRVEVGIEDLGTNNPYFAMEEPWKPAEVQTEEVSVRKVMLGKVAAEETFFKNKKKGVVFVVFEKRIQLRVEGTGIEDTSLLVSLAKKVNFEDLKKALAEKSK